MHTPQKTPATPESPLQILVLAPQPFFQERGTPIAVRVLAEELAEAGHGVDLLVFHEGQPVAMSGVTVHRTPALPGLRGIKPGFSLKKMFCDGLMLLKSLRLVRRKQYHVIHAVEEAAFLALVLQFFFDIPFVYDMDSLLSMQLTDKFPLLVGLTRSMEWCEQKVMRRSRGIVAVCQALEEKAKAVAPTVPVVRLEDISLLGASTEAGEDIRREHGIGGCVFMYVGNLESYQGIDLLLEAFALFPVEDRQRASLVVIGGRAEDIAVYRDRANQLALGGQVFFLGPRPVEHLGHYLAQADVLVSPRIQGNNTPMKIYSYLDSGRPILATRIPSHTQVLDGSIALLAEAEPHAFMQAMTTLQGDEPLRRALALAARETVRRNYSREAFRGKLRAFYHNLDIASHH